MSVLSTYRRSQTTGARARLAAENLKPHPFSELLPVGSSTEWESLLEDIRVNGQRVPIVLYEGMILDGRRRWSCVVKLNRKPTTTTLAAAIDKKNHTDADAVAYVYSSANHRNMSESQKACAAVKFLTHFKNLAKTRMIGGGQEPVPEGPNGQSRDQAGNLFGVSGRYVSDARFILEHDPKLFQQCFDGQQVISRAKRLVQRAIRVGAAKAAASGARLPHPEDHTLIVGDCLGELPRLPRRKFRLCFIDPPYNLGFRYHADPTRDNLPPHRYLQLIGRGLKEAAELLTPDGALCVMIAEEYVAEYKPLLVAAGLYVRRLIVWHESFGENGKLNFGRTCRFIWYATRSKGRFVFNGDAILVESKRASVYADARAMPGGKVPDALWDFSRLCGTFAERIPDEGIPTQLPVELLRRAVLCFTEPGDEVLDYYAGTGTTARAALSCGRRCTSIERSKKYAAIIQRELIRMSEAAVKGASYVS